MKKEPEFTPGGEVECDSHIILAVPRDAVRLKAEVTLLDEDGQPHVCTTILGPEEIRQARQDFLDNVDGGDDYDAVYTLTDKGRELLDRLEAGEEIDWDNLPE